MENQNLDGSDGELLSWLDAFDASRGLVGESELYARIEAYGTTEARLQGLIERYAASRSPVCDAVAFCLSGRLWSMDESTATRLGLRFAELCAVPQSFETLGHVAAMVLGGLTVDLEKEPLRKLALMCANLCDTKGPPSCELLLDVLLGILQVDPALALFDGADRQHLLGCIQRCQQVIGAADQNATRRVRRVVRVLKR